MKIKKANRDYETTYIEPVLPTNVYGVIAETSIFLPRGFFYFTGLDVDENCGGLASGAIKV